MNTLIQFHEKISNAESRLIIIIIIIITAIAIFPLGHSLQTFLSNTMALFVLLLSSPFLPKQLSCLAKRGAGVEDTETNLKVPKCSEAKVDYSSASSSATWVDLSDAIPFWMRFQGFFGRDFLGENLKISNLVNVLLLKLKY